MSRKQRALVIGDDTRSFLSTVRSLGRQGIEVHAAPYNLSAPALVSRYISQIHILPYYLDGGSLWLTRIQTLIQKFEFDIIIPCEERSLLPLYKHRSDIPANCKLAIPNREGLEAFFDKVTTRQLAETANVAVAKGHVLVEGDTAGSISAALDFPIIAKYRKSYSWPDLYIRTSVKILQSEEDLLAFLQSQQSKAGEIFFEEMFSGFGLGVSVLCSKGQVIQAFEHHRAHEFEGTSYYRKSARVDSSRLAAVERMVKAVEYTGLAMFEFKQNTARGDQWVLLEVNARPWGSLPLPVALGVDFPFKLFQLLVRGEITQPTAYRVGVYGRNLISDIWQLRALAPSLWRSKGKLGLHLLKWFAGLTRILVGREHYDVLVLDDPKPGLREIKDFAQDRLGGATSALNPDAQLLLVQAKAEAARQGREPHIVFLCQGNICRSPYAELKAQQLSGSLNLPLEISSAGMLPRNRRASPDYAIKAAAARGVDLVNHRSQHAFEETLNEADVIVLFDAINERALLNRYPALAARACYLSQFSPDRQIVDIEDPDGSTAAKFDHVYEIIDRHLMSMMQTYR